MKTTVNIISQKTSDTMCMLLLRVSSPAQSFIDKTEVVLQRPTKKGAASDLIKQYMKDGYTPDASTIEGDKLVLQKKKYKPLQLTTGISLPQAFWNNEKKQADRNYPDHADVNKRLELILKAVEQFFEKLDGEKPPTKEAVQHVIKKFIIQKVRKNTDELPELPSTDVMTGKKDQDIPTNFIEYIKFKQREWATSADTKEKSTRNDYNSFIYHLDRYQQEKKMTFDILTLTDKQVKEWVMWFGAQPNPKNNNEPYRIKYVGKMKKFWKLFITEAKVEDDIEVNVETKKKYLRRKEEKTDKYYLTIQLLEKIKIAEYDSNCPVVKKYKVSEEMFYKVRDLAIVVGNCGYRWSDMEKLRKHNFTYDEKEQVYKFHLYKTQKVKNTAIIPLFDNYVVDLFNKYEQSFPIEMEEQTFNDTIKAVCKAAGEEFSEIKYTSRLHPEGGDDIKSEEPFYECITHRTFRRTFASNLIRVFKVPIPVAMYYTTHDTEKSFKTYIVITKKEWFELGVEAMQLQKQAMKSN